MLHVYQLIRTCIILISLFIFILGLNQRVNVIYAVDASYSVSSRLIDDMSAFIAGSLNLYDVSPNQTQVGVSSFDVQINEILPVSEGKSVKRITDAFGKIQPGYVVRDLPSVIKSVTPEMFDLDSDTKGSLVVLVGSDKRGAVTVDRDTENRIKLLEKAGIKSFFIGIGKNQVRDDYLPFVNGEDRNIFIATNRNNIPYGLSNLEDFFGRLKGLLLSYAVFFTGQGTNI